MARRIELRRPDHSRVVVVITDRADGDYHIDAEPSELHARRAAIVEGPWAVVRQVHGDRVIEADEAGPDVPADAIVTAERGRPIAVQGADCAPVALITSAGPVGVAHVGWRGLLAGVLGAAVARLRLDGDEVSQAIVGPAIGPECYAFGENDLARVESRFGPAVRGRTADGGPALDLRAGIASALAELGVHRVGFEGDCTACSGAGFSHRADGDPRRLALVTWIER